MKKYIAICLFVSSALHAMHYSATDFYSDSNTTEDNIVTYFMMQPRVPMQFCSYVSENHGLRFERLNRSFGYDFHVPSSKKYYGQVAILQNYLIGGIVFYECAKTGMAPCSSQSCWHIHRLITRKACQKLHIGVDEILLRSSLAYIKEKGGRSVHTSTSSVNFLLYAKFGFKKESDEVDAAGYFSMAYSFPTQNKK